MKITNDYSYRNSTLNNSQTRSIKRIQRVSTPQMQNDSVSFTGVGKLDPRNLKRLDRFTKDMIEYAASKLEVKQEIVDGLVKRSSKPQKQLFITLTEKYNCDNFYRPRAEKENPNVILSLVDTIQFPTTSHFRFANTRRFNVTEVAECMEKLEYNPTKIKKFHRFSRDVGNETKASSTDLMSVLNSENSEEYLSRYSVYEPYFKRHITEPDAVKKLDAMVAEGTYDAVKERKIYELEKATKGTRMAELVDVDRLAPYSSKESNEIIGIFSSKLSPSRLKDKSNYAENLAEIYSTTTKDNFAARSAYLDSYLYVQGVHEYGRNEMDNITKLFRRMDEDPSAMSFIQKVSVPESNSAGAEGFLKILDEVTPEKRELYTDNIREIMSSRINHPAEKAVKFCSLQPGSTVGKFVKGAKSYIGELFAKRDERVKFTKRYRTNLRNSGYGRIQATDKPEITSLDRPITAAQAPVVQEPKVIKRHIFVNRPAKQPSAQKLQVISDVNNLIEKKLGKNTLADQSKSYAHGATKMRLSMLPEIFESIKDTRAQKRAAGTFSKHKSESNADALTLYNMINGRNKRFVNYMLKVKNEDGSRVYSVKDIIATVGETEKSIRMAKFNGNPVPPAEAKAMYSTMLDEKVAQHGKLPRATKKS